MSDRRPLRSELVAVIDYYIKESEKSICRVPQQFMRRLKEALTTTAEPGEGEAVRAEREACVGLLAKNPSELRLMLGEMSAQEMRTAQAVLGWARRAIRARSDAATGGE